MKNNTLSKFKTSENGLNENEVQKRREKYGLNELIEQKPKSAIFLF